MSHTRSSRVPRVRRTRTRGLLETVHVNGLLLGEFVSVFAASLADQAERGGLAAETLREACRVLLAWNAARVDGEMRVRLKIEAGQLVLLAEPYAPSPSPAPLARSEIQWGAPTRRRVVDLREATPIRLRSAAQSFVEDALGLDFRAPVRALERGRDGMYHHEDLDLRGTHVSRERRVHVYPAELRFAR